MVARFLAYWKSCIRTTYKVVCHTLKSKCKKGHPSKQKMKCPLAYSLFNFKYKAVCRCYAAFCKCLCVTFPSCKGLSENVHGNFAKHSTFNFSLRIYCANSCHCSASSNKDNFSPICWPFSDISKTANFPCHHLPSIIYTNNTNKP